jgi:hypothetical protein
VATPESKVKRDIKNWLDERGFWRAGSRQPSFVAGWYYMPQNMGMGVSGIPDFIGSVADDFLGAKPWAIEAKAPGGKPTQLQLDRHAEMRHAGWLVFVVDDVSTLTGTPLDLEVRSG